MKRYIANGTLFVLFGLAVLVAGCASYYKVKDPLTGNVYFTQKIDNLKGGAVKLKDARSGDTVTIQNSEVKQLNSNEYFAGLAVQDATPAAAPVAAPPAAAVAPAPDAATTTAPDAAPATAPDATK